MAPCGTHGLAKQPGRLFGGGVPLGKSGLDLRSSGLRFHLLVDDLRAHVPQLVFHTGCATAHDLGIQADRAFALVTPADHLLGDRVLHIDFVVGQREKAGHLVGVQVGKPLTSSLSG